jgi:hypothetical protein
MVLIKIYKLVDKMSPTVEFVVTVSAASWSPLFVRGVQTNGEHEAADTVTTNSTRLATFYLLTCIF